MSNRQSTPEYDEYLETLARLKENNKPARVSDIASELRVSKASVSLMLKKLVKDGMVTYRSYGVPQLTSKGVHTGRSILRKHRVIHVLLGFLGVKRHNIHKEACALEHVISDDVEKRIKHLIKRHGTISLSSLKEGMVGRVIGFATDKKTTQRLRDMGLTEGSSFSLRRIAPFNGPFELSVRGSRLAIGRRVAFKVLVRWIK